MRLALIGRTVVCITPMSSEALNLNEFEHVLELGRPQSQVSTPPLLLADYQRLRLVAQGGQVQLEFKANASNDLIRRGVRELFRQVQPHTVVAVGFNVVLRVETDEDADLFGQVLNGDVIARRLGVAAFRPGLKMTYEANDSLDTLGIEPDATDREVWLAQMNRHYTTFPTGDVADRAIAWLAAGDDEVERLVRKVLRSEDD